MTRRTKLAALTALALLVGLAAIVADASARRRERDARRHEAVVRLTGLPDLALSSASRWLRHPSQAEPGAAFSDLPGGLDVDPAGAWIGPPRAILARGALEVRRR